MAHIPNYVVVANESDTTKERSNKEWAKAKMLKWCAGKTEYVDHIQYLTVREANQCGLLAGLDMQDSYSPVSVQKGKAAKQVSELTGQAVPSWLLDIADDEWEEVL